MMDRRSVIGSGISMVTASVLGTSAVGAAGVRSFPKGFHWGAATAGHQIEGNNVNNDYWALENTTPTLFSEKSGDACNSFEMWRIDLDLAKAMGLNAYRFSIEWARIEPEKGRFSLAMLDHYKAIIEGCRERGLTPMVTFNHWSVPLWFAMQGNWTNPDSPALFANYCDRVIRHLGAEIGVAFTLNEPNGLLIARALVPAPVQALQAEMLKAASRKLSVARFVGGPAFGEIGEMLPNMLKAHTQGKAAIKASRPDLPVGATLAVSDEVAVGPRSLRDKMRQTFYGAWLENVKDDDFVGVQNYNRNRWDDKGLMPAPTGAVLSTEGMEINPTSLAGAVRYVHQVTGSPILVTEHGYYVTDDRIRAQQLPQALAELKNAMDDGVPVLGYIHWTLIDNFEWTAGFKPKLGLASVDPVSFARIAKPSAAIYRAIAQRNAI